MEGNLIRTATLTLALLLPVGTPLGAEPKGAMAGETKAVGTAEKAARGAKSTSAPAKVELVDINRADKAELKTLPGIGDVEADRIIAGRPYLSKSRLTTQKVISRELYDRLKSRVIARPNKATAAKLKELQKGR